jgi:DNA-nicking Smr family endonuclease|tara:strand:- start:883 stop:1329 length:447 start_codon:yes stop_codon:yes gene_type:complete
MEGFKLRKGDMIVHKAFDRAQVAIVTKTTPRYLYYVLDGHPGRVKKERVWARLDASGPEDITTTEVHYRTLKNRRKQRKMRTLDLHGVQHFKAEEKIKKFLNFVELPCKIITGHSSKMKDLVNSVVHEYEWKCSEESAYNPGTLIITE